MLITKRHSLLNGFFYGFLNTKRDQTRYTCSWTPGEYLVNLTAGNWHIFFFLWVFKLFFLTTDWKYNRIEFCSNNFSCYLLHYSLRRKCYRKLERNQLACFTWFCWERRGTRTFGKGTTNARKWCSPFPMQNWVNLANDYFQVDWVTGRWVLWSWFS